MKKLSEQLLEMSQKAAAFEKRAVERNEENVQELDAAAVEAQKSVQSAHAAFAAKLDSMHESASAHWRQVQTSFNNQVATARSKAAERKAARELGEAQWAADMDENNAQVASEFAQWAAAEANAAMINATQSRAYAKSLENTTPSPPTTR